MNRLDEEIVLRVNGLKKYFPIEKGFLKRTKGYVKAVDDITFTIKSGQTMGLVGESGCGKTTTARVITRAQDPTEGEILFRRDENQVVDLAQLDHNELKDLRKDIQMIFQDPFSSLDPRMPILDIVAEPLLAQGERRKDCEDKVADILERVGLNSAYMQRYPHSFSGGQRQRIGIARALITNPTLIVADEPVSALDVSVQAQILNLMAELQDEFNLTTLFIAHDLSVIRHVCEKVAVMYLGQLVEIASTKGLYKNPLHPYTSGLMSAVPDTDPHGDLSFEILSGEVGDPSQEKSGCIFAERCNYSEAQCFKTSPTLEISGKNSHRVACYRAQELDLDGVE